LHGYCRHHDIGTLISIFLSSSSFMIVCDRRVEGLLSLRMTQQ
jgi:hypothetical protein